MYSLLQRKFPQKTGNWKDALLMSLIAFLVLFLLKPFGLDRYDRLTGLLFPVCLGYAVITFLASLGFQRATACFVRRERALTLLDVLLSSLLTWLLVGLVNFLYSILLFQVDTRHWGIVLFYFVFWTFIIGSLLTLITVLINYNRYLKSELAEMIHRTTDEQKDIRLTIRDEAVYGECLEIPINHFLYAESMKNDLIVWYQLEGVAQSKTFRMPLSRFADQMAAYPNIFRCHRSFVVNVNTIREAKGNSNGYLLRLGNAPAKIPVSRANVPLLKRFLDE